VHYRDARAPRGYDAAAISQDPGDLIFYGMENTVAYTVESELPLQKLLLRLSLQRQHGRARELDAGVLLYLTARRGLGPLLAEYFHRAQSGATSSAGVAASAAGAATTVPAAQPLRASAALCDGSPDS